jgi:hypothetical protein
MSSEAETVEVSRDEYDFLVWFAQYADFGPADGDVRDGMREEYERQTGRKVPRGWRGDEDES